MTEPPAGAEEVEAWRRATRKSLLAARAAIPPESHREHSAGILRNLRQILPPAPDEIVGAYWPMRGEVDPRPFLLDLGCALALPVVTGRGLPLQFRLWQPDTAMQQGVFGTLHPAETPSVEPVMLLVPLVGFDPARYRLGYGGGYYDRTLQAVPSKPKTIGLGFELSRLATIYPRPYDVPLDTIVTERGCF